MDARTYRIISSVCVAAVAFSISVALVLKQSLIVLIAAISGFIVQWAARRSLDEAIADERTTMIEDRTSGRTLRISTLGLACTGLLLVILGQNGYPQYSEAGYILMYVAAVILVIRLAFYYYYSWKYGG
jgi:uncharacterized membrane protein